MRARNRRSGFTLVEAMMVVAIIGTLFMVAPQLLLQTNRFFILSRARTGIQSEARAAMYTISRNLHQAQLASVIIDRAANQPYCSRITFTKVQGETMIYYQSGTNLIQQKGSSITTLSKSLRYLAFTFPRSDDLSIVSVSVTLEQTIYEQRTTALHMASERVRIMN